MRNVELLFLAVIVLSLSTDVEGLFNLNKTIHDCIRQLFGEDEERAKYYNDTVDCLKVLG
jgi:hypothetical protein